MIVMFCHKKTIYKYLKQTLSLKEYQANDITLKQHISLTNFLPFPVSFKSDSNFFLCPPPSNDVLLLSQLTSYLGMLYITLPHSILVYIDDSIELTQFSIVLSLLHEKTGTPHAKTDEKILRPIFFDLLVSLPDGVQEMHYYTNSTIHHFLSVANRYWESHHIHMLTIPSFLLEPYAHSHTLGNIEVILQRLQQIQPSTALPNSTTEWLLSAESLWRLSSTEFKQLHTLLEGYHHHQHQLLDAHIQALLLEPIRIPEDRNRLFKKSKQLLINTLH